jgi:D-aminopeptidase
LPKDNDFANLSNSNLSYFVGLNADETFPTMILSGDRNLVTNGTDVVPGLVIVTTQTTVGWSAKMHNLAGNFGLADGSVQQGTGAGLQTYFSRTGTNINRLAVP